MYYSGGSRVLETFWKKIKQHGLWMTPCVKSAQQYGYVLGFEVSIKNPLDLRELGWQTDVQTLRLYLELKGVKLPEKYYAAFHSSAINEDQLEWFTYAIVDGFNWREDRRTAFDAIEEAGYDCILLHDTHYGTQADSLVILDESQIISYEDCGCSL